MDAHRAEDFFFTDLKHGGMIDEVVGSLFIPYGYSVELFTHDARSGTQKNFDGPMFRDNRFAMECKDLGSNNETRSLTVKNSNSLGGATGSWVPLTGSSTFHYEITEGWESSHSVSQSDQYQYEMSIEMGMHFGFKIAGENYTIK